MIENNLILAIDLVASLSDRVRDEIWVEHGQEIVLQIKGASGGERRVHEICASLWTDKVSVNLNDMVANFGGQDMEVILLALRLAGSTVEHTWDEVKHIARV